MDLKRYIETFCRDHFGINEESHGNRIMMSIIVEAIEKWEKVRKGYTTEKVTALSMAHSCPHGISDERQCGECAIERSHPVLHGNCPHGLNDPNQCGECCMQAGL